MAEDNTPEYDRSIEIGHDANDSVVISGDGNQVTYTRNQIIQISATEVKTRSFILTSPYKGLKKFEQTDKDRFFGREQFVRQLINELNQTNLLLLLGASGSGKSSVVRAGLIPQLAQKWGDLFVNLTFSPDNDPFESLYAGLLNRYGQTKTQFVRQGKAGTLVQVIETLKSTDAYWLIFVDQFEELFTTSQVEKCNQFISDLVQLNQRLKQVPVENCRIKIVAAMRSDFLDRLSPYPNLVKATDHARPIIAELQLDELRLTIEQPAAHHGVVFEDKLVEEIIKSVEGQAGYLPLLQYTLNLLWETEVEAGSIHDRTLNISTYRELGGVRGALQRHVDHIYGALSKEEQLAAQRIFLKLVDIGKSVDSEADWKPLRRRVLRSEFSDNLEQQILTQLIDANLLVSDRSLQASESTVEVAHEVLLTAWTTLEAWIRENRQAISLRNRLEEDVSRWTEKRSDDELWSGSKLAKALELRKDFTFHQVLGGFSEVANQFIDASVGLRDRLRRRITSGLVGGLIVALGLAGTASWFWLQAEHRRVSAELVASSLTAEALRNANLDLDALIEAIRMGRKLQQSTGIEPDVRMQVVATLQQVLYGIRELNRWSHDGLATNIKFSPDGKLIAVAFNPGSKIELWSIDGRKRQTLSVSKSFGKFVNTISFSPDSQIIAANDDKDIKIWNINGQELQTLKGHFDSINSISFSSDGRMIASASEDKTIKLWSADGRQLKTLIGHRGGINKVIFSPDGRMIASASKDKTIKLWSIDGRQLKTLIGHRDEVNSISFSPDMELIASVSRDEVVKLWNLHGQELESVKVLSSRLNVRRAHNQIFFTSDSKTIVYVSAISRTDTTVKLWKTGAQERTLSLKGERVAFSDDGQLIAFAKGGSVTDSSSTIILMRHDEQKPKSFKGHNKQVVSLGFTRDGQTVLSAGADNTVKLWNLNGQELKTLQNKEFDFGSDPFSNDVSFSPNGKMLADGGETLNLWSIDGNKLKKFAGEKNEGLNAVSFSLDGSMIATASNSGSGKITLWNIDGKKLQDFVSKDQTLLHLFSISFNPDGKSLVTGGRDNRVKLWSTKGQQLQTLEGHTSIVRKVSFSPDGKLIASIGADSTIKLWNIDGKELQTLKGHDQVADISFSPNSQVVVSVSSVDGSVKFWNLEGKELKTIKASDNSIFRVRFSPDGKNLILGCEDGTLILWDLDLDTLLIESCNWVSGYLRGNSNLSESDRHLCDGISTQK